MLLKNISQTNALVIMQHDHRNVNLLTLYLSFLGWVARNNIILSVHLMKHQFKLLFSVVKLQRMSSGFVIHLFIKSIMRSMGLCY